MMETEEEEEKRNSLSKNEKEALSKSAFKTAHKNSF